MSNGKSLSNDLQNSSANYDLMRESYNIDIKEKAGVWFFNSSEFMNTISISTNIVSSIYGNISNIQSVRNSVVGKMQSPEGKEIQGSIGSCFDEVISSAQDVASGVSFIVAWATQRFNDGVQAGQISTQVVNSIQNPVYAAIIDLIKVNNNNNTYKSNFLSLTLLDTLADDTSQGKTRQEKLEKIYEILSKSNPGGGTGSVDSNGNRMYQEETYLETMQKCWKALVNNGKNIRYEAASNIIPYDWSAENWNPNNEGHADCSSFVSWTLYERGYDEFKGNQHCTIDFTNQENLDRWKRDYGWKVDTAQNGGEAAKKVKAGDIVVFDGPESYPEDEHMFIVKEVKEDGTIVTYDAGDQSHWTNEETQAELNNDGLANYTGSEEGTTSGYFSENNNKYNRECTIISIEDVSWSDVDFLNSTKK